MTGQTWIISGALLGGIAVALGAFGSHGLKEQLESSGQSANFETAVRYQMYHALALVLIGLFALHSDSATLRAAGICMLAGTLIFSGLLYGIVFTGQKMLGAIVPIGGVLLIAGWMALAAAAWRTHTD